MNFLSVVKKVGHVFVDIEHVAAPVAELLFPVFAPEITGFDGLVSSITGSVVNAEVAGGFGAAKSNAVVADFEAGLASLQAILKDTGYTVGYDPAALQSVINGLVAAANAAVTLKSSIKVVKVAAPAG